MSERALLPGEQEAWERAKWDQRWSVKDSPTECAWSGLNREGAVFHKADGQTIAYRARSVRPDGTPVAP